MEFSARQIAELLNGKIDGDPDITVKTVSKIEEGFEGSLSFLANSKYIPHLYTTKASVVLINKDFIPEKKVQSTLIKVDDAYKAFASLLEIYQQYKSVKPGIHGSAHIEESALLGKNVFIGAHVYIGENSKIADNSKIYANCTIGNNVSIGNNVKIHAGVHIYDDSIIGDECIIHSGTIIGSDGFGFAPQSSAEFKKVPQIGNVIIEDRSEIGANTTIDRATLGSTIIRKGVKLDNLIQVAHNVEIGENTVIAAQVGISGSTKIGKNCMIGGQVGFAGHLTIGDNVKIGAQAGVNRNIADNMIVQGSPAIPYKDFFKSSAIFNKLPELYRTLYKLEKKIEKK